MRNITTGHCTETKFSRSLLEKSGASELKRRCRVGHCAGCRIDSMGTPFNSIRRAQGSEWARHRSGRGLVWARFHLYDKNMKRSLAVASVLLIATLAVLTQGVAAEDRVMVDSAAFSGTKSQLLQSGIALKNDATTQPPIAPLLESASSSIFRDVPSVSGRYSFGRGTIWPYVGAGYSGGFSSEVNRSFGGAPLTQHDFGLRSQFGQSFSPNEFQMGIRIPF